MRIVALTEFQRRMTQLLRAGEPILVMRHRKIAAVVFPRPEKTLGLDLEEELATVLGAELVSRAKGRLRRARISRRRGLTVPEEEA